MSPARVVRFVLGASLVAFGVALAAFLVIGLLVVAVALIFDWTPVLSWSDRRVSQAMFGFLLLALLDFAAYMALGSAGNARDARDTDRAGGRG